MLQPVYIPLMDVRVCVHVKAHTLRMIRRSRARLRYSAAMRVAILLYRSCCLPFVLVLFSRLDPPSLFIHPLSLPCNPLSFLLFLLSVSARPRAYFSSAFVPPGFLSSRKLACSRASIVNVFCYAIFVKFLSVNWESYVRYSIHQ